MAADLVDVIFLDIDGVLLPFGGIRDDHFRKSDDPPSTADGSIFPDRTMDALTSLLRRIRDISPTNGDGTMMKHNQPLASGNPVLVLSSTWRARPEFVEDILSSFRAYASSSSREGLLEEEEDAKSSSSASQTWESHMEKFFDITDPNFHATRHDEIYKWVNANNAAVIVAAKKNDTSKKFTVRSWIALDDEDLVNVEGGRVSRDAMQHAVRTESSVGLTMRDVGVGIRLAEKQINDFHDGNSP